MGIRLLFQSGLAALLAMAPAACDSTNFFEPFADKTSDKALLEEALILIDKEDYDGALARIGEMEGDSNKRRVAWTGALLGQAEMGVLDIAKLVNGGGNLDDLLDNLDDTVIFGTGATRTVKLGALDTALDVLGNAPDPEKESIRNLSCILSGVLSLPTISESITGMNTATSHLTNVLENVEGAGLDSSQCPGVDDFATSLETISGLQATFDTILSSVADCPILDLSGSDSLNSIETSLRKFTDNADSGCEGLPDCGNNPACQALQLTCVSTLLSDAASSVAGDGEVSVCELVQNCLDPTTCF